MIWWDPRWDPRFQQRATDDTPRVVYWELVPHPALAQFRAHMETIDFLLWEAELAQGGQ